MTDTLELWLATRSPAAREVEAWGELRLQVDTYLSDSPPPLDLVTSVRAIVFRGPAVVVVRDPERFHILPGGRREPGETPEQTLRREILEETGWAVGPARRLGVKHFHHLTTRPADYPYPYPDFLQLVERVDATDYLPHARESNGYEISAELMPLAQVWRLPLSDSEQALLKQAEAVDR